VLVYGLKLLNICWLEIF